MTKQRGYYITSDRADSLRQLWFVDGDIVVPADGSQRTLELGRKGLAGLRAQLNGIWGHLAPWRTIRTVLEPNQYYPRISRPHITGMTEAPGLHPIAHEYRNEVAGTVGQLEYLTDALARVLQVVHPEPATLRTYGHEIRNLLIIACTEVEAQCKAVLDANEYARSKKHYSTADYVKLTGAMKLGGYSVQLVACPWLAPVSPFTRWRADAPTKSLAWYDAYNAVKHDRETNFRQAQLRHAISAVAACAVLAWCQFGEPAVNSAGRLQPIFQLVARPQFRLSEVYTSQGARDANGVLLLPKAKVNYSF